MKVPVISNHIRQTTSFMYMNNVADRDGAIQFEMAPVVPARYFINIYWSKNG
jgi:hypothetical protein